MIYTNIETCNVIGHNDGTLILGNIIETYFIDVSGEVVRCSIICTVNDRKYDIEKGIITMLDGSGRVFTKCNTTTLDDIITEILRR